MKDANTTHDHLRERQLAQTSEPREQLNHYIETLFQAFGEKWWVTSLAANPLPRVWWRKDWLATTELITLGRSLAYLRESTEPATFERWIAEAKKPGMSDDQRLGHLWEAYAAGILADESQAVALAPANNPGIDLVIRRRDGLRWNFSCKRLLRSDEEKRFQAHAARTYRSLQAHLRPGQPIDVHIASSNPLPRNDNDQIIRRISRAVESGADLPSPIPVRASRHMVHVRPLQAPDGAVFSRRAEKRSMVFSYVAGRSKNEHRRFNAKVQEACSNLTKNVSDKNDNSFNTVIMRVQDSVSLTDAYNWLVQFFEQNRHPRVYSVLVVRPIVRWTLHGPLDYSYYLSYESMQYVNPRCERETPGELLVLTGFLGRVPDAESVVVLSGPSGTHTPLDHYMYTDGHVAYSVIPESPDMPKGPTWGVPVVPNYRVVREVAIPDGPVMMLGAQIGNDLLGLRERDRPLDLTLL